MQVKEILRVKGNRLVSAEPAGRAVEAVSTMAKENLGSLVVMEQGRMVGMLTFHELLRALASRGGALGELRVGDIMSRDYPTVDGRYNLQTFTDDFLLRTGRRCFVVVEDGRILGLITPQEVTAVERAQWPYTTVYDAMRPIERLRTITPETPLAEALATVGRDDVNQLPVVSNGRLEGIISRAHILSFLQTRADLKV